MLLEILAVSVPLCVGFVDVGEVTCRQRELVAGLLWKRDLEDLRV